MKSIRGGPQLKVKCGALRTIVEMINYKWALFYIGVVTDIIRMGFINKGVFCEI